MINFYNISDRENQEYYEAIKVYKAGTEDKLQLKSEVLDEKKKTIVHIPSVNAAESSKEKYEEVNHIVDVLGELKYQDEKTGVLYVKSLKSGKILKVADLVNDDQKSRDKISNYLRH